MLLGEEFRVETPEADSRDSYLVERGIETFFILPQTQTPLLPANRVSRPISSRLLVVLGLTGK